MHYSESQYARVLSFLFFFQEHQGHHCGYKKSTRLICFYEINLILITWEILSSLNLLHERKNWTFRTKTSCRENLIIIVWSSTRTMCENSNKEKILKRVSLNFYIMLCIESWRNIYTGIRERLFREISCLWEEVIN